MAMFEQMRANVGKLLKGIDRSEPGRRERFWPNGVEEFLETARGSQNAGLALRWHFSINLEEMFKETALQRLRAKR